mgnify:CR=1 FL=1
MKEIMQEYTGTAIGLVGMMCFLFGIGTLFFSDTGLFASWIQIVIGSVG